MQKFATSGLKDIARKYPVLTEVCRIIEERDKISKLFPSQEDAIKTNYLEGKSLVVSIPTSGGKTLVAELAALKSVLEQRGKVVYTCPLRSLAMEKFEEFKEKYEGLGVRVALSIGDFDSMDPWLTGYDIIVTSFEKFDSLIRHSAPFIKDISLLIVDEIHTLDDATRGPTLEVVITKMRKILPNLQILALSATIPNAKELAGWLNSKVVLSNWRPVPLYEGIFIHDEIIFKGKRAQKVEVRGRPDIALAADVVTKGKQAIIFVNSRRSAEATAEKAGKVLHAYVSDDERTKLDRVADEVLRSIESPTVQCKRLAKCIRNGTAFHHAGLTNAQRRAIERAYRNNLIKLIVCTPTLGAGVNLPNYRSICRDLRRYISFESVPIPVREYKQWAGRSGRISYDDEGEAIIIARWPSEFKELWKRYIEGKPESVYSKLSVEPTLRMHTLALIATEVGTKKDLLTFFKGTFFFYQYKSLAPIEEKLTKILRQLEDWGFVEIVKSFKEERIEATPLGKRVVELYIDPFTAHFLLKCLERAAEIETNELGYLHAISSTPEMYPLPRIRVSEEKMIEREFRKNEDFLLYASDEHVYGDDFLAAFKVALCLYAWINEEEENAILERFAMPPGELRGRIERAKWLLYSARELAKVAGLNRGIRALKELEVRVEYGVKKELLPLIVLPEIGRIRSRRLYNYGIKSISDVRKTPEEKLAAIIGSVSAARKLINFLESGQSN